MESRCAICGNRTEDMDLATVEFEGVSVKACPYCRKQLSSFCKTPRAMPRGFRAFYV